MILLTKGWCSPKHLIWLIALASALLWHQPLFAETVNVDNSGTCNDTLGAPYCTIQAAITAANPGDTIMVGDGTYIENVVINKNVTLQSVNGRAQTTIQGTTNGALGTVVVTSNTTGVVINGFTIEGIDNPSPGIESAALYFQGNHSNAQIRNNELVANGDLALLTEYGATISGFIVDNNIFSGQTFTGQPAGQGSSQQFTLANVPRPLVAISGGAGGGNTSNITFTNNSITGITGGINASSQEQGNSQVTIDSNGATITGNTFAGTTTYLGISLRSRGPNSTITGNTFSSTGMGASTAHLFTQNHPVTLGTVIAANDFDRGAYVAGANGTLFTRINQAIASATPGQTVTALPGLYNENVAINQSVSLVGSGGGSATSCAAGDPATETIIRSASDHLIKLAASGASSANKLIISNIRLELQSIVGSQHGISVATTVSNIKLERVRVVGNAAATSLTQRGLLVSTPSSINNWEIRDSSFNCLYVGIWFALENSASAGALADNVIIADSQFRENGIKGLYVEKLSNATIENNQFIDNNKSIDKSIGGAAHSAGLDINLKFGSYSNISIVNNTFSGNGLAAKEGAALMIKARDDGATYSVIPATLDTVTVTSNTITNNERGVRLGEPNRANANPTQLTLTNNTILSNTKTYTDSDGSTYGGFIDWTTSPTVAVNRNALYNNTDWNIAETNGGTVDGTCNWYGSSAGPGTTVSNTVIATPWLISSDLNGACQLGSIEVKVAVVGSTTFAPASWELTGDLGNFNFGPAGGSKLFADLQPGSYLITQTVDSDYDTVFDCGTGVQTSATGTINLTMAQDASCTFTNTLKAATLTVTKIVINNHGGTAGVEDFPLFVNGSPVTSGQAALFDPGTYTISESGSSAYSAIISGDCAANGVITLAPGEVKSCTITNDDLVQGTLNLTKVVVGGSSFAPAAGWQFTLDSRVITMPVSGGNQLVTNIAPGTYTLTEEVDSHYTTEVNCGEGTTTANSAQITVTMGQVANCVFTNTIANATLTVTKVVVNDNGGTAVASDFPLFVNGSSVTSGEPNTLAPGSYTVSESNLGSYTPTYSGDCANNGTITLAPGDAKSCTITNDDIPAGVQVAEINLVKTLGVVPGVCATTTSITVVAGETVYYCYTITNNGNVTLTQHTLVDNQIGTIINDFTFNLIPGQTTSTVALGVVATDEILANTINTGTWTAVATSEALTATASASATANVSIVDYEITVTGTYIPPTTSGPVGGKMHYIINVLNTGTAIIKNLQLAFVVPAGTVFDASSDAWSCADGAPVGTVCTHNIDFLNPGENVNIILNLDIVTQMDIERLSLELVAELEGNPTSPTSSTPPIVVYGPEAETRYFGFMPQLQR